MIQLIPQTEQNLLKCEPCFCHDYFFNSIIKKFPLSVSQDSFDTKPLYPIKVPFIDIIILFLKIKYFKIYFYFVFEIRVAIAFTISKNKLRNHVQFLDKVMKNGAW